MQRMAPLLALAALLAGCAKTPAGPTDAQGRPLTKIILQTDWYAQADHGGYYQAMMKGYYREAGLDVQIDQAGPMVPVGVKLATNIAQFGIGRSDEVIVQVARDIPYVIVASQMQHDPQALMMHPENPVNSFKDLNGKSIMTVPGANWIRFLQTRYHMEFSVIPLNFGMGQFMADKDFIQQCYITNEPYYVEKNGVHPKVMLISDSGFDPYRVLYGNTDFVSKHPAETRAFVQASIRGWEDYMHGDPTPANQEISRRNIPMTADFIAYAIRVMREHNLVWGDPAKGESTGSLSRARLQDQINFLQDLGVLDHPVRVEDVADFQYTQPR